MNGDVVFLLMGLGGALGAGLVLGVLLGALLRRGAVRPAPVPAPEGNEILRIDGNPADRKLSLRVAGTPVDGADSIADAEVREHVRALMRLLGPESDARVAAAGASPTAADTKPAAGPARAEPRAEAQAVVPPIADAAALSTPDEPDDLSAPFLARLTASLRPQAPVAPLKPAMAPMVRKPKAAPATQPPAGMPEQINAILQRKLAGQPQAPDIKLFGDEGELRIQVGDQVFRRLEEVTDERVRGWIRDAVAEWEAGIVG